LPALHDGAACAGGMHTLPQLPQLEVSVSLSTQDVPQVVLLQATPHAPSWQTCRPAQALPHTPQLLASDSVSTHLSEHFE
jgi:hypothetical protein